MAFENVNFGLIPQSKMQQQSMLMQSIGQGMQAAQNKQEMDLRRRQLEMQANEFDFKGAVQQAAIQAATNGVESLSPQQIGLLKANDALNPPQMGFQVDSRGQLIPTTSGGNVFDALSGRQSQPAPPSRSSTMSSALLGDTGMGQGTNPAMRMPVDQIQPVLMSSDFDMSSGSGLPEGDAINFDTMQAPVGAVPQLAAPVGAYPDVEKAVDMANVDLQKEAASQGFEISKEERAFNRAKQLKEFETKISTEAKKADLIATNKNAIPLIEDMIKFNRNTLDMPYAEMLRLPTRMLSSDQATNLDLMQQNRLELAAPLAKELGVNPTDKDFQASLDRIVDLNASKKSREKQLQNLLSRIKGKSTGENTQEKPKLTPEQAAAILRQRGKM
jgi:hypothetical protein